MVLLRFEWHNPLSLKLKLPPPPRCTSEVNCAKFVLTSDKACLTSVGSVSGGVGLLLVSVKDSSAGGKDVSC